MIREDLCKILKLSGIKSINTEVIEYGLELWKVIDCDDFETIFILGEEDQITDLYQESIGILFDEFVEKISKIDSPISEEFSDYISTNPERTFELLYDKYSVDDALEYFYDYTVKDHIYDVIIGDKEYSDLVIVY